MASDWVQIRVLEGHYRGHVWAKADTILELPWPQAEAMLRSGTAELAPAEPIKKVSSPLLKRITDAFARLRRPGVKAQEKSGQRSSNQISQRRERRPW